MTGIVSVTELLNEELFTPRRPLIHRVQMVAGSPSQGDQYPRPADKGLAHSWDGGDLEEPITHCEILEQIISFACHFVLGENKLCRALIFRNLFGLLHSN